jgi:stearoyl-CoA desaturase (Delta-9 desaturase)
MIPDVVLSFLAHGLLDWPVWKIVLLALAMTHFTIAAVTIYLHRHQAHRALELHPLPSHIFRLWLWLSTGMQTKDWAAIHRKHHAKCETPDDPHSPQTRGIKKVFWQGAELYREEAANVETLARYGHGTPDDWLERHVYSRYTWHGIGIMLVINWIVFGIGIGTTIWAVQMAWIPIWAAGVVNGIGHYVGYRNFNCEDASRNISPIAIFIGGEELHNNHHTYPTSAKLSNKWYEFDIGWMYIRILAALGLATVKKIAPTPKFAAPRAEVDAATLQAVIAHRYDVMATYAKSVKQAYREEVAKLRASSADRLAVVKLARLEMARKWLHKDAGQLSEAHRAALLEGLAQSQALHKVYDMRAELAAIWQRSSHSADHVLIQLQDWCKRAEESGVRALQEFSLRLRTYA